MGRRPSLSTNDRSQAVGMLRAGQYSRHIAAVLGVAQSTMSRLFQSFNATQLVSDRRSSGRPRTKTRQQDNYICNITLRNLRITGIALQHQLRTSTCVNISDQTVWNRLRPGNLRSRRPAVRTTLTQRHRRARRDWCHQHIQWTRQQWSRVLFSNESRFNLHFNDGRTRAYRRQGERFSDATVSEYDRFGGGLVVVLAGVTMNQRTRLCIVDGNLNAQRSLDDILQPVVVPFLGRMNQGAVLLDDNALPTVDALLMNLSDSSISGDLIGRPTHLISTQSSISGMSWD